MLLAGKTAIVTGAGKGIGRAIALAYAEAGADVALVSRTERDLVSASGEVDVFGRRGVVVVADVAKAATSAVHAARRGGSRRAVSGLRHFG